uniref:Uncharacterized protein n=1 Tax=Glossina morsitans morsitans TaxID=37546 RepID=A0A1B0GEN1_GLOMM
MRYRVAVNAASTDKNAITEQPLPASGISSENTVKSAVRSNLSKHEKRLQMKMKNQAEQRAFPSSPIFMVKSKESKRLQNSATKKPFYEGQINYYVETDDVDDNERQENGNNGERIPLQDSRPIVAEDKRMDQDWFRKLSPVLRNGIKANNEGSHSRNHNNERNYSPSSSHYPHNAVASHHRYHRGHHYIQHHHSHHRNQLHNKQHPRHRPYQRKMIPKKLIVTESSSTPVPPPSYKPLERRISGGDTNSALTELGHQITEMKDLERYYAKWPHLARVQFQVYDEHYREAHPDLYDDYEYDSINDFDDTQVDNNDDDNLPPYIKKYNRRNKQLLNLLEGTLTPPTKSSLKQMQQQFSSWSDSKPQSGPRDNRADSAVVRIDDDYLKEKRKRYHYRQHQEHDLFKQQRANNHDFENSNTNNITNANNSSITITTQPSYPTENNYISFQYENHLPDEDVSISLETNNKRVDDDVDDESDLIFNIENSNADASDDNDENIWQKEIKTKSNAGNSQMTWQLHKLQATTKAPTTVTTTMKAAFYKLPSYPAIVGNYMNKARSRSSQFAPSSGSELRKTAPFPINDNNNFVNAGGFVAYNGGRNAGIGNNFISKSTSGNENREPVASLIFDNKVRAASTLAPLANLANLHNTNNKTISSSSSSSSNNNNNNNNNNHASTVSNSFVYHRVVDASPRLVGAGLTGRKQRLPFVAITDRRLETSKKFLVDHQKDFEQNLYPLP